MWSSRFSIDESDDDDEAFSTELPTLKSSARSASEGEGTSDSTQPYPLLTLRDSQVNLLKQSADRFIRKQSTTEESQAPAFHAVMDRIEDEVEAHAYEEMVPLDVKLALEDKVFGWTHLTSSIIGHIVFTWGAYWLTFQCITIVMNQVSIISTNVWASRLRIILSLWAAITTFRMVRRRRHIWLRSAYGSKSYKQDAERRRQEVAETDRTTALGRFVQSRRHRQVMSKLKKAETQFAKKQQRQQETLKLRPIAKSSSGDISDAPSSPFYERQGLLDQKESDDLSYGSSGSDYETDAASSSAGSPGSPPLRRQQRRPSFNTKPTHRMRSVGHDEILMEEMIRVMPYSHGGFFGAAPFLLSNPHWISLLRYLMPDVYVEISRRVAINPPSRLIHWAENNPVVAAYGAAHALEQSSGDSVDESSMPRIPNLEWDVFLDPALVRRVQIVLDQHAEFRKRKPASDRTKKESDVIEVYYNQELKRRSHQLVDKILIAHGNILQLAVEQMGILKDFNYSRVKRTRRTLGGGIYARQWMAVFAEALRLGVSHEDEAVEVTSPSKPSSKSSSKIASLFALAESTCPETTLEESVKLVEKITGTKQPIGLVLDIKSRHVPHHIWAVVVDTLRTAGIRVEGVASFCIDEVRDISRFSNIGPIPGIIFGHSAGDIQQACHQGMIQNGDKVFFNAGSLLVSNAPTSWRELVGSFDPNYVKRSYRVQPCGLPRNTLAAMGSCLQDYKERYNLSIGVYCQEFAIDESAVQMLVKLVNEHSNIYDLGFSWGGINGITIKGIAPGRFTQTDGYWNQRHIGAIWNYDLHPPSTLSPAASPTNVSVTPAVD